MTHADDRTELAELAAALRAERPQPTAAFATELDARVASGFASDSDEQPGLIQRLLDKFAPLATLRVATTAATIAFAGAVGVVTVNQSQNNRSPIKQSIDQQTKLGRTDERFGSVQKEEKLLAGDKPATGAISGESDSIVAPEPTPPSGGTSDFKHKRDVEQTATLELATAADQIQTVSDKVFRTVATYKGFVVDSSVETSDENSGSATFTLRIPTANLSKALGSLSELAHVRARSEGTTDITGEVSSTKDQLKDAKTERKSLLNALAKADTTAEIESIKSQLKLNKSTIAGIRGELRSYHQRTSYSTVNLTISADENGASGSGEWGIDDALGDAGNILEIAASVGLLVLLIGAPAVVIIWLVKFGVQRNLRGRRESALDKQQTNV